MAFISLQAYGEAFTGWVTLLCVDGRVFGASFERMFARDARFRQTSCNIILLKVCSTLSIRNLSRMFVKETRVLQGMFRAILIDLFTAL